MRTREVVRGAILSERRDPTDQERKGATDLARKLRRIRHPHMDVTRVHSPTPPGQVDLREAMRLQRQVEMKQPRVAKPFIDRRRGRVKYSPLTVGIMCDISGSMSYAQEPLAVARWMLADAVHSIQGRVATVLFGDDAHGIQRGRQRQRTVDIFDANGGWENYVPAFSMIDGELDLIDGDGARLLVIITDGYFNDSDVVTYAEQTMDMCRQADVAVIWLNVSGRFYREDTYGYGKYLDGTGKSAVEIATELGDEVVTEFKRVMHQ